MIHKADAAEDTLRSGEDMKKIATENTTLFLLQGDCGGKQHWRRVTFRVAKKLKRSSCYRRAVPDRSGKGSPQHADTAHRGSEKFFRIFAPMLQKLWRRLKELLQKK